MSASSKQCVHSLIERAGKSEKADDALKFSQAAANAANALCAMHSLDTVTRSDGGN